MINRSKFPKSTNSRSDKPHLVMRNGEWCVIAYNMATDSFEPIAYEIWADDSRWHLIMIPMYSEDDD